jgi:rare lipoprotein A
MKTYILLPLIFLFSGCFTDSPEPVVSEQKRYNTSSPYEKNGKRYFPKQEQLGYTEKGYASWYGDKFHNEKTASGEVFNMFAETTAHRTLPMNSMLHIKNLENGNSVVVRVNDRGPFVEDRILDLSKQAAKKIGLLKNGVALVEYKVVGYNGEIREELLPVEEKPKEISDEVAEEEKEVVKNSLEDEDISTVEEPKIEEEHITVKEKKTETVLLDNIMPQVAIYTTQEDGLDSDDDLEVGEDDMKKEIVADNLSDLETAIESTPKEVTNLVITYNKKSKPEVVEKTEEKPEKKIEFKPKQKVKTFLVQVNSFSSLVNAEAYIFSKQDLNMPENLKLVIDEEKGSFKVRVFGFPDEKSARDFSYQKEFFPSSFVVIRDRIVE